MLSFIFFFESYDDLRDLHSFPTRRSSDLRTPSTSKSSNLIFLARACKVVFGILGILDRKSTRLNSSHVEISYAVFCLKKKIDPQEVEPRIVTQLLDLVRRPVANRYAGKSP